MASPADEVKARVTAAGERRMLAAALARRSTADRDTILLVVWGQLSYEQAAASLRVPVGIVRSRMNRARRKLRTPLDLPGPPPGPDLSGIPGAQASNVPGTEVPSDE